jgi:hypothetical protein
MVSSYTLQKQILRRFPSSNIDSAQVDVNVGTFAGLDPKGHVTGILNATGLRVRLAV